MTFYTLTRAGGPWTYQALGFTAIDGAVLDGSASTPAITSPPDQYWAVGGSVESGITRFASPSYVPGYTEPADGAGLVWNASSNVYEPTAASLSATYAAWRAGRPGGNTWVAMGDSITSFNIGTDGGTHNEGWYQRLIVGSKGRVRRGGEGCYATGGFTLEQIETTHLPQVLALDPAPGACVIAGGANNLSASAGAGFDFATAAATLDRIIAGLRGGGIVPVLWMVTPNGTNATIKANISKWNTYIYRLAQREGLHVLDAFTPLVDPATGGMLTAYKGSGGTDEVHPDNEGHAALADYWLTTQQVIQEIVPYSRPHAALWADTTNLVASGNGLFGTDSNADGVGDGWSLSGSGTSMTPTLVAPIAADDLKGQWQQLAQAVGGAGSKWVQAGSLSGWSVGDRLAVTVRVQTEGLTLNAGLGSFDLGLVFVVGSSLTYGIAAWKQDITDGLFTIERTVPPGCTGVYVRALLNASSALTAATELRIGEVTVRNLTVLGLD